jgi:hypothetical protein
VLLLANHIGDLQVVIAVIKIACQKMTSCTSSESDRLTLRFSDRHHGKSRPEIIPLSEQFLNDFHDNYLLHGAAIIDQVRKQYPTKYFDALVKLAQVMKIEIGDDGRGP